ncbi:NAD/NADP octopine/nopaline dehydrogenase family protein [Jiangella asiatica]|uniref:Opine dehydrogenase domain-containing protein n=1 Tax=Jiangella asiatica TaxID=2530372 RepID=A0A4R5DD77_9ACTN|nr:NAD/NADP octopine/nopaline dehydrogenase family protein [Jiangella asiatica]TDE08485.1 hypothetical protein E1269_17430 [Jiangella asiatica]
MSIVVVGSGLPALACALYASACSGDEVELLAADAPDVARFAGTGIAAIEETPADVSLAVRATLDEVGSDLAIVVADTREIPDEVTVLADRSSIRSILLAPGGFAGALRARAALDRAGRPDIAVAEAPGFPVLARRPQVDEVRIVAVKRSMPIAGLDAAGTDQALLDYGPYLPALVPATLATTSLSNVNTVTHPPLVLLNAARIDAGEPFLICRDGLTAATSRFLTALDQERLALVEAAGGDPVDTATWLLRYYGQAGMSGADIGACIRSFQPLMETPAPPTLDHRYLTDDIPHGVAAYLALARRLGTPHQHLAAIVTLSSTVIGHPLAADGDAVEAFLSWLEA